MREQSKNLKLPVGDILSKTVQFALDEYFRILIWSFPAVIITNIFVVTLAMFAAASENALNSASQILSFFLLAPVAIMVHRNILSNEEYPKNYISIFFQRYYWAFIGTSTVLGLLMIVPAVLLVTVPLTLGVGQEAKGLVSILSTIAIVVVVYVLLSRLILVLPMTAAERQGWINEAWRLTKNNALRMFLIILLAGLIPGVMSGASTFLVEHYFPQGTSYWTPLVLSIIFEALVVALYIALNASALSFAYSTLSQGTMDAEM